MTDMIVYIDGDGILKDLGDDCGCVRHHRNIIELFGVLCNS